MAADPPVSLLITPDQRRRLQQRYEEAQRLAAQPRPDYRQVHELLAGCVAADPGNILYLNALLANLRRRDAATGGSWWRRMAGGLLGLLFKLNARTKHGDQWPAKRANSVAATAGDAPGTLVNAPQLLWNANWLKEAGQPALLRDLAAAAERCDFDEVLLRYLGAARHLVPDDAATLRAWLVR